jgi:Clostripain family
MVDKVDRPDTAERDILRTLKYVLPPGAGERDFVAKGFVFEDKLVSNPKVFSSILTEAMTHFKKFSAVQAPRQKILIFWGHGGGMVMLDEKQQKGVERARANVQEFAKVLVDKLQRSDQQSFDIIAFDSCYMCMIETMYELRNAAPFALCSSTMVDADGFPYEKIINFLKSDGNMLDPGVAVEKIAQLYNEHYLEIFPDGNRFLFVCKLDEISPCVDALNAFGKILTALLADTDGDDPVRDAISEALIGAGVDSSYVYVLQFLKMLPLTLQDRISPENLKLVRQQITVLREAIENAFKGNLGDTTDKPVSPLIWAPFQINSFIHNEANYSLLDSSVKGEGGWITLWWTFHRRRGKQAVAPSELNTLGLPITSQLAV